jgi:LPS sulfotransferase NodH
VTDPSPGWAARIKRDIRPYAANLLPARAAVRFCILTAGRSGSELLVHLLDAHPAIRCEGEVLRDWHDFPFLFARGRLRGARYRGFGAWGFKINQRYLTEEFGRTNPKGGLPALVGRLRAHGFVFVHVRRRDLLRQALSGLRADLTGLYHLRKTDDEQIGAFDVDVPELMRILPLLESEDAELTELVGGLPHRTLWYEDDLSTRDRQQAAVDGLCDWLGLARAPVTTEFEKLAPPPQREQVKNYDEVAQAVGATRFGRFLDDSPSVTG